MTIIKCCRCEKNFIKEKIIFIFTFEKNGKETFLCENCLKILNNEIEQ